MAIIVLGIAMMPCSSHAYFLDGNKLWAFCESPPGTAALAMCWGFVAGVSDVDDIQRQSGLGGIKACVPESSTIGQLVDVTRKYMKDFPEYRHFSAATVTTLALVGAFPCP